MKYISIKDLFPKLYTVLPGLIRGTYHAVTAASGVGKSKFTKALYVQWAYEYCKKNKIPLKIIYFALEESVESFWTTMLIDKLKELHGISITYYQYIGAHPGIDQNILDKIELVKPLIEDMKNYIEVYDYVSNPTGLLKTARESIEKLGHRDEGEEITDENGNTFRPYEFKYTDPDQHVIIILDHISLITTEKDKHGRILSPHEAISRWSQYVVTHLCKKYNAIVCNVHQQEMAGDNVEAFKVSKLEPELSKLGDNKLIGRDYHIVFGIFSPDRYELGSHLNYDIKQLKDKYRCISIIKHRNGVSNVKKGMFFDGTRNFYKELPDANIMDKITYEKIRTGAYA